MQQFIPDSDLGGTDTIKEGFVPPRILDESYGTVTMQPNENLTAGDYVTLHFEYLVGDKGVDIGGILRIGTPCSGWGEPLLPYSRYWYSMQPTTYMRSNTNVELVTSGHGNIESFVENKMLRYTPPGGAWRWWISIRVLNAPLNKGDRILVTYGDKRWGETGVQVQKFLEEGAYFLALVDICGDNQYVEIPDSPISFDVVSGSPQRINVTIPSLLQLDQPFDIRTAQTDKYLLPTLTEQYGEYEIKISENGEEFNDILAVSGIKNHDNIIDQVYFEKLGLKHIQVSDLGGKLKGLSNPAYVSDQPIKDQIFWGDIHTQSKYHGPGSWSVRSPSELYRYARDVTHLDFAAVTDDVSPLGDGWLETQQAAMDHYEPGKFVSFKAFEWCSKRYGHRNTIFNEVEVEDNYPQSLFDGNIEGFWEFFRNKDVIMIPHHTFLWTKWEYHKPELEPLVEIRSCWGTSEKPGNPDWTHSIKTDGGVQAALGRGYKLGIIGSTDTCTGLPGRSIPNSERWSFHHQKGGLAAVYAPELTRDAIFEALKNRRTYGTTGVRIILDFDINGHPLGSELMWDGNIKPRLKVKAIGTDLIRKIEIIRNNEDIQVFNIRDDIFELDFEDCSDLEEVAITDVNGVQIVYYYVRLTQYDGEMAWSSPIWLQLSM
jgi:hypothetical protein